MRLSWFITILPLFSALSTVASSEPKSPEAPKVPHMTPSIAQRCLALKGMAVEGGQVVSATMIRSSSWVVDKGREPSAASTRGRPFCRVEAESSPAAGADIKTEVWLPVDSDWTGKFFGTSNGGMEPMDPNALANGLARGYAVADTDVGTHASGGPENYRFAIAHAELAKNYAYRGIHVMTVVGKKVVTTFYKRKPIASLFAGCSGAGYEAIGEAHRYPRDYDGIIAGDPAMDFANLGLAQGYRYVVSHRSPTSSIPPRTLPMLAQEVLSQCDGLDGLVDGIIDDPRRCSANFLPLACKPGAAMGCLNSDQITALQAIYSGLHDPRTGTLIYPGFSPGAELSGGADARISGESSSSFVNDNTAGPLIWALGPSFRADQWMGFDFGAQGDRYRRAIAPFENNNPDFTAFSARGGKLLIYSGWADANLNPLDTVHFFEAVQRSIGGVSKARSFSRLFMVPGMYHCTGGPGPNSFGQPFAAMGTSADNDVIMAMDRWVATGAAPERIIATKFEDDRPSGRIMRTRPLCAFPRVARWNGVGSIDDASQFRCVEP